MGREVSKNCVHAGDDNIQPSFTRCLLHPAFVESSERSTSTGTLTFFNGATATGILKRLKRGVMAFPSLARL